MVASAAAASTVQFGIGVKRVVKAGHKVLLIGLKKDTAATAHLLFATPPRIGAVQTSPACGDSLPFRPMNRGDPAGFGVLCSVFPLVMYQEACQRAKYGLRTCFKRVLVNAGHARQTNWPAS
jgi:hypothetical protein